jgi:hypothetical protein
MVDELLPVLNLEMGKPRNINPRDATAYDIPFEAKRSRILISPEFQDAIILDIRKRLRKVEKQELDCNEKTLSTICELIGFINIQSRYIRMLQPKAFDFLIEDIDELKKKFIYNCRPIPIEKIRTSIEWDLRDTFSAISEPMDPEDRMEMFIFYISGLMKGYISVFENMDIEFDFPLIDDIMSIFRDYEKGELSADDAWKDISIMIIKLLY